MLGGATATANWNDSHSAAGYVQGTSIDWGRKSNYATYAAYQSGAGQDKNSPNVSPLYNNVTSNPPNLDLQAGSPALNAESTSLTCSVGYCGSGTSIYGSTDYAGNPRINGSGQINIGAYEH